MPGFLESEFLNRPAGEALFHVHPVPYEATVSYGGGTAEAPEAILAASQQLEVFDGYSVPGEDGIHTGSPVDCSGSVESVFETVAERASFAFENGCIPVLLGGEHGVTNGAIRALKTLGRPVGIVQIDAHDDLRDSYQGSKWSHACVMRRALEAGFPLCQVGVRALSPDARALRKDGEGLVWFDAERIAVEGPDCVRLPEDFPTEVYLTLDVDGLDPSLLPATGTPEPGGLGWWSLMHIVGALSRYRRILGFDVVELAPAPGLRHCDFIVARAVYNIMGWISRSPRGTPR